MADMTLDDFFIVLEAERLKNLKEETKNRAEILTDNWELWGFAFSYEEFLAEAEKRGYKLLEEDGKTFIKRSYYVYSYLLRKMREYE
jgi:hypothetical protein